jgi:hypothetical protein
MTEIQENSTVIFYDSDKAFIEKDFSGKDKKFYPQGTVIKIYKTKHYDPELLADIRREDGSISTGHFVSCLKLINNL